MTTTKGAESSLCTHSLRPQPWVAPPRPRPCHSTSGRSKGNSTRRCRWGQLVHAFRRQGLHRHPQRRPRLVADLRRRPAQLQEGRNLLEDLQGHPRSRTQVRRHRRVLPWQVLVRLRAEGRTPPALRHRRPQPQGGRQVLRGAAARCLPLPQLQHRRPARQRAGRQAGGELGREHVHPELDQQHQPDGRRRVPPARRGDQGRPDPGEHALPVPGHQRRADRRRLLPTGMGPDGDRQLRHLLLHHRRGRRWLRADGLRRQRLRPEPGQRLPLPAARRRSRCPRQRPVGPCAGTRRS